MGTIVPTTTRYLLPPNARPMATNSAVRSRRSVLTHSEAMRANMATTATEKPIAIIACVALNHAGVKRKI